MMGHSPPVPRRLLRTRCRGEIRLPPGIVAVRIKGIDGRDRRGVCDVEALAGQSLKEKPNLPRDGPSRFRADHFDKRGLGNRLENSFEYQKIDRFMAHCEGQVSFERRFGAISLVVDIPGAVASFASANMPLRNAGRVPDGRGDADRVNESGPAD